MLSDCCLFVCHVLSCLFVTLVYCGQTVGRIKMKLGMQVGLGPGQIVLDGDPAPARWGPSPPLQKGQSPNFRPISIVAKPLDASDATWYGGRPNTSPRRLCVRWGPSSPPQERGSAAPLFSAHVYCGHGRPSQRQLSSC